MYLNMDRQGCVIKTVAYSLRTYRHTDTQTHTHTGTDKSLKTEGPKILSNEIFYFRTVFIGGPIANNSSMFYRKKNVWLYEHMRHFELGKPNLNSMVIFHLRGRNSFFKISYSSVPISLLI